MGSKDVGSAAEKPRVNTPTFRKMQLGTNECSADVSAPRCREQRAKHTPIVLAMDSRSAVSLRLLAAWIFSNERWMKTSTGGFRVSAKGTAHASKRKDRVKWYDYARRGRSKVVHAMWGQRMAEAATHWEASAEVKDP